MRALKKMNNLVTLVLDNNRLRTLDDFDLGAKSRLITLSANNNEIVDAIRYREVHFIDGNFVEENNIEELPGEWGNEGEESERN